MDLLNIDHLKDLIQKQQEPSVSIYMPTYRTGKEVEQGPIRLKNLLNKAEKDLSERGVRSNEIREILQPAETLLGDNYFWTYQADGLVVFLSKDNFLYYRLPIQFNEFIIISGRFYVKPLLPLFNGDGRFFILALGQRNLKLYQGSRFNIRGLALKDVAPNLEQALKYDEYQKEFQYQAGGSRNRTDRPGLFHGHGGSIDDAAHKKDVLQYFQMVDKGVREKLRAENAPLVLVGVEWLIPLYKEANSYPNLLEDSVQVNPRDLNTTELHQRAWEVVQPQFQKTQQQAIDHYHTLSGTGKSSNDLEEIVRAAFSNRIEILFVNLEQQKWGQYIPLEDSVVLHEEMENGDEDLLDFAAVQTLSHNGLVFASDNENMPTDEPLAAVFRF